MKITYDREANASYIYFTSIGAGGVAETIPGQKLDVALDEDNQIVAMLLFESEDCEFRGRLKYAHRHQHVAYDESGHKLEIIFSINPEIKKVIAWDANIDLDGEGQVLGVEILYADFEYKPDGGPESLYVEGRLKHVSKYIVPFDALY